MLAELINEKNTKPHNVDGWMDGNHMGQKAKKRDEHIRVIGDPKEYESIN